MKVGRALGCHVTRFLLVSCLSFAHAGLRQQVAELAENGRLDSALALAQSALKTDKGSPEALLLAGKLQLRGDLAAKSWQTLKNQSVSSPEQAEALYLLGQYHYAAGRYHQAIPEFRDYFRRYPGGEDADRAGYWMANACLHLALTQNDKATYLDTGLAYLAKMPSQQKQSGYYAALATESAARLRLALNQWAQADSLLQSLSPNIPADEAPAILLLRTKALRAGNKAYAPLADSLLLAYPQSPEASYLRKIKGKLPRPAQALIRNDSGANAIADGNSAPIPGFKGESAPGNERNLAGKPVPDPVGEYTLQVGAFSLPGNAQALVEQLRRKGITASARTAQRAGKSMNEVRVGAFADRESAAKFGEEKLRPLQILYQIKTRD